MTFRVSRDELRVQRLGVQQQERACPVDGLGDGGHLLQIQLAQILDEGDELAPEFRWNLRHAGVDDALLEVGVRKRDVQVQAATLQRVGNLAGVVAGEEDDGRVAVCLDGAYLGDRDLEVGEDLQQERLELVVGLVHLVDEQHAAFLLLQRLQERAGFQGIPRRRRCRRTRAGG